MERSIPYDNFPEGFHLLDDEKLVHIQAVEPRHSLLRPSSIREIYRLTHARNGNEIGAYGPAVAALSLETDETIPEHQGLYDAVFGRDSLRVALDLIDHYPRLARSTLKKLAEYQGVEYNEPREEEPGRIAHEIRTADDPIAQDLTTERGWGWPYYGSVDATPEFIRTLAAYCFQGAENEAFLFDPYTDKNGETKPLHAALTSAVEWTLRQLNTNPEGLLEFQSILPKGIENQAWKDSWDAYHHHDGTIANHNFGISSIEVQTVTHDALLDAARLYDTILGQPDLAKQLREQAERLRETILSKFWTNDHGGYFVLGLDRDETGSVRQLKIRTSNMGHVLNSSVLDGDAEECIHKRSALLRQLSSPELLATSGIRTLASDEVRYREGAYHNGSVWIWDTHHIAKGARRHADEPGFIELADELDRRILKVVKEIGGFPEYVRGGSRIEVNTHIIDVEDTHYHKLNRVEQPPQEVQAWSVAAILAAKYRLGRR